MTEEREHHGVRKRKFGQKKTFLKKAALVFDLLLEVRGKEGPAKTLV